MSTGAHVGTGQSVCLVRSDAELGRAIEVCGSEPAIGLSIATTGPDPFSDRIGTLWLATREVVHQVHLADVPHAFEFDSLRDLLAAERPVKIAADAKRTIRFLEELGIRAGRYFEPRLIAAVLSGGTARADSPLVTLPALTERYFGQAVEASSDGHRPLADGVTPHDAGAREAAALVPLRAAMVDDVLEAGLLAVAKLEMDCLPAIARMEHAGLPFDVERWEALVCQIEEGADRAAESLRAEIAALGLSAPAKLKNGNELLAVLNAAGVPATSTQGEHLETFAGAPLVARMLEFKRLSGYADSFGRNILRAVHPVTGRLHGEFLQMGAGTGRIQSRNPPVQNIPKAPDFRECIRAGSSRVLVVADCSQMELRILAELSGDEGMREAFRSGADLHRTMAAMMYRIAPVAVTAQQRSAAKTINFGLSYGMGAPGLATKLRIDVEAADAMIRSFFRAVPAVERYLDTCARDAARTGYARNPLGRIIRFTDGPPTARERSHVERQAKNAPMQSTNADAIKRALAVLDAELAPLGGRIVNCVHDEIVAEGPREHAEELRRVVEQGIVRAVGEFVPSIPVIVDAHVADSWAKSDENRLFGRPAAMVLNR